MEIHEHRKQELLKILPYIIDSESPVAVIMASKHCGIGYEHTQKCWKLLKSLGVISFTTQQAAKNGNMMKMFAADIEKAKELLTRLLDGKPSEVQSVKLPLEDRIAMIEERLSGAFRWLQHLSEHIEKLNASDVGFK